MTLRPLHRRRRINRNTLDDIGTIRLSVALIYKDNRAVPGNITKSWRFPNTRVSALVWRIERMLDDELKAEAAQRREAQEYDS